MFLLLTWTTCAPAKVKMQKTRHMDHFSIYIYIYGIYIYTNINIYIYIDLCPCDLPKCICCDELYNDHSVHLSILIELSSEV